MNLLCPHTRQINLTELKLDIVSGEENRTDTSYTKATVLECIIINTFC